MNNLIHLLLDIAIILFLIAASVGLLFCIGGMLYAAYNSELYEDIEDWIEERRSKKSKPDAKGGCPL